MKLKELDESKIRDIGRAFGYYDYGGEKGLVSAYSGPEATAEYICGYVRGMLDGLAHLVELVEEYICGYVRGMLKGGFLYDMVRYPKTK